MVRTVRATRYVTPLREGGSLPAIVEADDEGLYVLKFRGAGQGPLALAAEWIAGEIGRALGLNVPEIVLVDVDAVLGRNEPDEEIRDLLKASVGLNLALDYLPGATMFDRAAGDRPDAETASTAVVFDAFVTNVDRTIRNPNLLMWHKKLFFIDHGAALYFHHGWKDTPSLALSPFAPIRHHLLLPWAAQIPSAAQAMKKKLNQDILSEILREVPESWLARPASDYLDYFVQRLSAMDNFVQEAIRVRANLV
jgi:hypothetical protein